MIVYFHLRYPKLLKQRDISLKAASHTKFWLQRESSARDEAQVQHQHLSNSSSLSKHSHATPKHDASRSLTILLELHDSPNLILHLPDLSLHHGQLSARLRCSLPPPGSPPCPLRPHRQMLRARCSQGANCAVVIADSFSSLVLRCRGL